MTDPAIRPERFYTLQEAAALIHSDVRVSTLQAAIANGKLVRTVIGRRVLVAGRDLINFLEAARCPRQPEDLGSSFTGPTDATGPAEAGVLPLLLLHRLV